MTSNLAGIIRRLEGFNEALPAAVAEVADPKRWINPMRYTAEHALKQIAEADEMMYVPLFLTTVVGMVFEKGMAFEMSDPFVGEVAGDETAKAHDIAEGLDLKKYGDVKRARRQPLDPTPDESRVLEDVRLAILEWVQTEKIKTEMDAGLTDEEIAERVGWIMGVYAGSHRDRTSEMDAAGARLAVHIQQFMASEDRGEQLSAKTIHIWLLAVLNAWREKLERDVPQAVLMQIRKTWRETGERLI